MYYLKEFTAILLNHSKPKKKTSRAKHYKFQFLIGTAFICLHFQPTNLNALALFPPIRFMHIPNMHFNAFEYNEFVQERFPSGVASALVYKSLSFQGNFELEQSVFNLSPAFASNIASGLNVASKGIEDVSYGLSGIEKRRQYISWFAESFTDWGFKYKLGGVDITSGIDCSAFVRFVFNYFDTPVQRTAAELYQSGIATDIKSAQMGDLIFFGKKHVEHVALVTKNDHTGLWVVHSTTSKGIIKENILQSPYWLKKLKDKAVNIIGAFPLNKISASN